VNSEDEIAVRCRSVTKIYGAGDARVTALQGVDLEVRRGELLMLVGPSGCGKTTLLAVIVAILERDGGECTVFGRDLQQLERSDRARFRGESIGFVFQMFNLLPALTIEENVAMPLLIRRFPRSAALRQARNVLDAVGLEGREHAHPGQLSGGQQQRVAIARALVHNPKLVMCDEPTSNLDRATGHIVMDVLRRVVRNSERALIVVTHDNRIFEFADRIARMDDGKVVEVLAGRDRLQ